MKKLIVLLFILSIFEVNAQSDTLFLTFRNSAKESTARIISLSNGYGILNYNYNYADIGNFYSLYLTDFDGNIMQRLDTIRVGNMNIESIQNIEDTDEGILLLANVQLGFLQDAFISIWLDYDLKHTQVRDTFYLNKGEDLIFLKGFKQNTTSGLSESFGLVYDPSMDKNISNIYVSHSKSGKFSRIKKVSLLINPTYIMDFVWMPDRITYFLTYWDRTSMTLDEDFNVLKSLENTYTYKIGDTTFHTIYTFYGCDYNGAKLVCAGTGGPKNNYNFSMSEIGLEEDSLYIKSLHPLLPAGTRDDIVLATLTTDGLGNYIGACAGLFNPFNNAVDPNKLYVTKLTQDLEPTWQIVFQNGKEMANGDMITDKYDDIGIIGSLWDSEFLGKTQGYFLKIFHDGSFTNIVDPHYGSYQTMKIYPCPAHEVLFIDMESPDNFSGDIMSLDGRLNKSFLLKDSHESLDISSLTPGTYYIHFYKKGFNLIQTASFVKI
ncbi:MAG: hypothetical protein IPP15_11800 [Saprospiraceae bacterium]|uniref:Secretion system C-terminal sorting domain-containing protein n=1 Tax=Candidatus Opimibacter skivensis TaxID=2982028 RepID=A0A9D7STM3_9BACT|nr:hypothetical protein [Candidatus Opimibacter skivensis]